MIDSVINNGGAKVIRVDAIKTSNIEAILIGVATPLVVGIDAACPAKIMFGSFCVELIKRQVVCT